MHTFHAHWRISSCNTEQYQTWCTLRLACIHIPNIFYPLGRKKITNTSEKKAIYDYIIVASLVLAFLLSIYLSSSTFMLKEKNYKKYRKNVMKKVWVGASLGKLYRIWCASWFDRVVWLARPCLFFSLLDKV